jgi:glyoxylase-like metal-dependent hydrolase (beta-lactamase superfamily II)
VLTFDSFEGKQVKIDTIIVGAYQNNCYVVRKDERQGECILIDTGLETGPVVEFLRENELRPTALLLTHGHPDHIAGIKDIKEAFEAVKVFVHQQDVKMLQYWGTGRRIFAEVEIRADSADVSIEDGMRIEDAGLVLEVIHTPGHTPGGVCYYSAGAGVLFSGDTLFLGSVGRTDFEYSNTEDLLNAVNKKLMVLPETTKVYPGHGPATTIRNEKRHNPYLK